METIREMMELLGEALAQGDPDMVGEATASLEAALAKGG